MFASFRMNPSDINIVRRCEEIGEFFTEAAERMDRVHTADDVISLNAEIEEKFDYLLGYEASKTLFKEITATTILPGGELFAALVMDKIQEAIRPELDARRKKALDAMSKYTEKYE